MVIDRVLTLYLATLTRNDRLPALLQCALPYTACQPFNVDSGAVPDEMFFGRTTELATIRAMPGTSLVYGGRQLGKTALLQRAEHLDHNPKDKEFAIFCSFLYKSSEEAFTETLVKACNDALPNNLQFGDCKTIEEVVGHIKKNLKNGNIKTMKLFMDETDDFLQSISQSRYKEIQPLVELQRKFPNNFKIVFAGLHNVCRTKNAIEGNPILSQLGSPLCVKPLGVADALNMLVRPLTYLGYKLEDDTILYTILTNTNYYPGIIQFFGHKLVEQLHKSYTKFGDPPRSINPSDLGLIMKDSSLKEALKQKIMMTLEVDPPNRYYMILALCIAALYYYNPDSTRINQGFSVNDIKRDIVSAYKIKKLQNLSEDKIIVLLKEMEEMGILSCQSREEQRYSLRRRTFIDVIGKDIDTLDKNIMKEDGQNA